MRSSDQALADILLAAEDAASIVARGRENFDADRLLKRASKNLVAEIGEAAKFVDDDTMKAIPDVPWSAIKGMRSKVVHDYSIVDLDVLWVTLTDDIPDLAAKIVDHLARDEPVP